MCPPEGNVRGNHMYYPQTDVRAKQTPRPGEEEWTLAAEKSAQLVSQRSMITNLIYTVRTRPHVTAKNPTGIDTLWGDTHVSFNLTKKAFDPSLRDEGEDHTAGKIPATTRKNFAPSCPSCGLETKPLRNCCLFGKSWQPVSPPITAFSLCHDSH